MQKTLDKFFTRYPNKSIRLVEVISPSISLFLISMPFWASYIFPVFLAYFIIFFNIFFVYKSFNLARSSFIAAKKIQETEKIDWHKKLKAKKDYSRIRHLVVVPSYQENIKKLKETINSIKNQTFPADKIYIFLALEKREKDVEIKGEAIKKEFRNTFAGIYVTLHPDLPNEVKGKSSNEAYAGREANRILIEEKGVDIDFLTVTSCDADTIFDRQFFSLLGIKFLQASDPYLTFWQSATVYHSNFWQVPAFTRVMAFFGTLWRAGLLVQHSRLIPHSTYSLTFKLLKEIGYWDTDVIPEDYRIFFKAFFKTKGKVHVEPMFLKTTMDSPQSYTYVRSLMSKYHQERRWSWGVADDAIYIKWWLTVRDVPFWKKTHFVGTVLIDHILWPVNWFIITISANLVVILNPVFTRTNLGYNLPRLSGFILTASLVALVIMIYVDYMMRPRKHHKRPSKIRQFLFPLEFILMPVSGFFLSALPALISHIQLITGKRLEYKVTEKV